MKNSKMPADWIARAIASNPIVKLPNGNIRTCPVRLAFVHLMKGKVRQNQDGSPRAPSFECGILFPPGAQQGIGAVMWPEWLAMAKQGFPQNINPQGQPFGLHWPLHPCDEKQNLAGYTPGCYYLNISSQFKPALVDSVMNPVVDENRVYAGVWAIVALNLYSYGIRPPQPKKGISFGLQTVMIIADDEKLGGGGSDPNVDFAGVQIDAAFNPASAFGTGAPLAAPPSPSLFPIGQQASLPSPATLGNFGPPPNISDLMS